MKEKSKSKIRQIVGAELGAGASELVLEYIATLEELTKVTSGPIPTLSPRDLRRLETIGRRHSWSDRALYSTNPKEFLLKHYSDWVGKGLTMAVLRKADQALYHRLNNWRRIKGNELPPGLLPSRNEVLGQRIDEVGRNGSSMSEADRARMLQRISRRHVRAVNTTARQG